MLYIYWGEDEFSRDEALRELKKGLGDAAMLTTNTSLLDGQKLTINDLKAAGETMPFLSPVRLLIIQGLLERFEPKGRSPQGKKGTQVARLDEVSQLASCLNGLPASTITVMVDTIEVKKPFLQNNPLFSAVAEKAEVRSFPLLRGIKLSQWIESRLNRRGASISRQAGVLLMDTVGSDLFTLANEIDKLIAFTAGQKIEEKDVRALVSASREADIFGLVDSVVDRNAGPAQRTLEKLLQNGTVPPQVLIMIARQVRVLIQVKELRALRRAPAEIQNAAGIQNPLAWEKTYRRADKYTLDRLRQIYLKLLDTDLAVKTGKLDGELALNLLVADLCLP